MKIFSNTIRWCKFYPPILNNKSSKFNIPPPFSAENENILKIQYFMQ